MFSAWYADADGDDLTGNGGFAMTLPTDYLGEIGSSSGVSGNTEDYIRVLSDTVSTDATWRAQDVPFMVSGDIWVQYSGTPRVTMEDGVVLAFDSGAGLYVGTGGYGGLDVVGSSTGVVMTA